MPQRRTPKGRAAEIRLFAKTAVLGLHRTGVTLSQTNASFALRYLTEFTAWISDKRVNA